MGSLIKEIGWAKLFTNGLPLRIVMVGTLTGLQWGIYDAYKVRWPCAQNCLMRALKIPWPVPVSCSVDIIQLPQSVDVL